METFYNLTSFLGVTLSQYGKAIVLPVIPIEPIDSRAFSILKHFKFHWLALI